MEYIREILGNRNVVLAREITKIHEEFIRGNINDILDGLEEIKGEFVILVEGNDKNDEEKDFLNSLSLEEHYKYYKNKNIDKKEIIKRIAKDRGKNKKEIYQYFLKEE